MRAADASNAGRKPSGMAVGSQWHCVLVFVAARGRQGGSEHAARHGAVITPCNCTACRRADLPLGSNCICAGEAEGKRSEGTLAAIFETHPEKVSRFEGLAERLHSGGRLNQVRAV